MKEEPNMFGMVAVALCLAGPGPAVPTPPAQDKSAQVEYFLGESKMLTAAGKPFRTTLSLVKRVVNPAENRIEEHVPSIDEKNPAKAFVVVMEVKGSKFTMSERSGAFTGEGELVGEPWKWKEWRSKSKLPGNAGTVTSADKVNERGLSAKKEYAGADGKVLFLFEDKLDRISATTYEILYARLAPAEKK
jgi:hypothetical protein